MQLKLYGEKHLGQQQHFNVGSLVLESNADHKTPARIIEVIENHGGIYYKIHFKYKSILQKVVLPEYRLIPYDKEHQITGR